ncbi:hypothetical protein QNH08_gp28 [Aeromonas phage pAh6.2TG]|uniref:Uncharacterized protein n=2 Tax=Phayathaivirus TaxID=3153015 RepID=A0A8F3C982_9CAUD|nr:hypothetical protein QNH08_gp28 [Aeromonas phage pAh6.2TG]YP_010845307.1 hypothetical protein QNH09_gp25 [Aeromonas phage PVN03]QLI47625.1 hypothetical protein [Aeromonas phage PVN02]QTQ06871.1 hypothetical protein [Aeromonas phage PVN04]QTQ06938.1 hypothetical protein [Aeromonas phage PVN05]QTQ06807.1 hypothetical protein [Aeromonas phage PVN03]QWY14060.1 hypothetical protein [Aeromonas phage pAh6.2TG]
MNQQLAQSSVAALLIPFNQSPEADAICPHCGTVVHGSYCGACDKIIEE